MKLKIESYDTLVLECEDETERSLLDFFFSKGSTSIIPYYKTDIMYVNQQYADHAFFKIYKKTEIK